MAEAFGGTLLIAEPFLRDPAFMRSVVLICKHSAEEGTLGFSLNNLLDLTLNEIITGMDGWELPVYKVGPVHTDTLHYLHAYPQYFPDAVKIAENIFWGGDFEKLKALIKDGTIDPVNIKFFLGYSGWSEGQLETEMDEDTWLTVSADSRLVFDTKGAEIWNAALTKLGGKYKLLIHYPTDPQLN